LRNLPVHLDAADDYENLFRLLDLEMSEGRNCWFAVKSTLDPSGRAYTADLTLAWAAAERINAEDARADHDISLLAREARYALAAASVISIATSLPGDLLAALVAEGLWNSRDALSAALQQPDATSRANVLASLAPYLTGHDVGQALGGLQGERDRSFAQREALAALAPRLSTEHIESAWTIAESLAHEMPIGFAVAALAPCLSPIQLKRTLELLRESKGENDSEELRASALAEVVQYLPAGMLPAARAVAETLRANLPDRPSAEDPPRDFVLAAIVRRRAQLGDATAAEEATGVGDRYWRAVSLVAAAECASHEREAARLLRAGRDEARKIDGSKFGEFRQAEALVVICETAARRLPQRRWVRKTYREACNALRALSFGKWKTTLIRRLVPMLGLTDGRRLLDESGRQLAQIKAESRYGDRDPTEEKDLAISYASVGELTSAFTIADEIWHENVRVETWAELLALQPDTRRGQVADLLLESYNSTPTLLSLLPLLPPDKRHNALLEELRRVGHIKEDKDHREKAISALARAKEIQNPHWTTLSDWARRRQRASRRPALPAPTPFPSRPPSRDAEVDPAGKPAGLEAIEPETTLSLRALLDAEMELMIYPPPTDANALPHVIPQLPDSLLDEACALARGFEDFNENICDRSSALRMLAVRLAQRQRGDDAIRVAREIEQKSYQALALGTIARELPPSKRSVVEAEAQKVAETIDHAGARAQTLIGLARRLQEPRRKQVLQAARSAADCMDNAPARARCLWKLARLLTEPEREATLEAAVAVAAALPDSYRPSALIDLAGDLPPRLLAKASIAGGAIHTPSEREKALASLVPELAERGLPDLAISLVKQIPGEEARGRALVDTAPHLEGTLLTQALAIIVDIQDDDAKATALAGTAPFVDGDQLVQAFRLAQDISYIRGRTVALRGLAARLAQEPRRSAYLYWQQIMHMLAQHTRADALDTIATLRALVVRLAGERGVADIQQAFATVERWWS
jgi:hypothetical protein